LEGTWSAVLPFLAADNRATAALLRSLAGMLPAELAAEIARTTASVPSVPDPLMLDVAVADERNGELRALLARAVIALSVTDDGEAARREIAAHLLRRLDSDPAAGRTKRREGTSL
jgi:hypothetical protein